MYDDFGEEANVLEHTRGWGGEPHGKGTAYSIGVAVRVRPMVPLETDKHCLPIVKMLDEKVVCLLDPAKVLGEDDYLRRDRTRERHFAFDYAFDETATQEHIFRRTTRKLLSGVVDGFNASCFAYGATGAGKTFTMLGDMRRPGIMVLTVAELFNRISQIRDKKYRVFLSYLEVYNENIRDLLTPSSSYLELREEPVKGVFVAGITEFATSSADETMELLHRGNLNRSVEPTKKNETSSRSHAVLQIMVEQQDRTADVSSVLKIGKLSLIDLAGSERASHTENRGQRLLEGANINRSLLALANCINALAGDVKSKRVGFVPYRDSKLTRLLKDSFGGNTRTVMIANLSPAHDQFEETLNTLKYANRAKNIKTRITQNLKGVSYHISEYKRIISDLRAEIKDLKDNLHRLEEERGTMLPPIMPNGNNAVVASGGGGGGAAPSPSSSIAQYAMSPARSPHKRKEKEEAQRIGKRVQELFAERIGLVMRMVNLDEDLWNLKFTKHVAELRLDSLLSQGVLEEVGGILAQQREVIAATAKEFEEKTAAKWAVQERLEAQGKHATELHELAKQKLHTSRLQHIELMFRNQSLQLQNMELQLCSRARVKLMERAVLEIQRSGGLPIEIPEFPEERIGTIEGLDIAPAVDASNSDQLLFSRSRRGRNYTAEPTDGLDLREMSDGEEVAPTPSKPVSLTQDVTTPRGRRRRHHHRKENSENRNNNYDSPGFEPHAPVVSSMDAVVAVYGGGSKSRRPRSATKNRGGGAAGGAGIGGGSYANRNAQQQAYPSSYHQPHDQVTSDTETVRKGDEDRSARRGRGSHHQGSGSKREPTISSSPQHGNGSYAAAFQDRLQRESLQFSPSHQPRNTINNQNHHSNAPDEQSTVDNHKLALLHRRQGRSNAKQEVSSSIAGPSVIASRRDRFAEPSAEPVVVSKNQPQYSNSKANSRLSAGPRPAKRGIFPPITQ